MRDNQLPTSEQIHRSHYYHSFFRGYTEAKVPSADGKRIRIKRVYTEDYIVCDQPKFMEVLSRILNFVLLIPGVYLFMAAGKVNANYNKTPVIALFSMIYAVMLILTFGVMLMYTIRPIKMTEYDYKSTSERLIRFSFICGIIGAVIFICVFLRAWYYGTSLDNITAGYLFSAILITLCGLFEKKRGYKTVENTNIPPEDGNVIL